MNIFPALVAIKIIAPSIIRNIFFKFNNIIPNKLITTSMAINIAKYFTLKMFISNTVYNNNMNIATLIRLKVFFIIFFIKLNHLFNTLDYSIFPMYCKFN